MKLKDIKKIYAGFIIVMTVGAVVLFDGHTSTLRNKEILEMNVAYLYANYVFIDHICYLHVAVK